MKICVLKGTLYLRAINRFFSYFVQFSSDAVGNEVSWTSAEWKPYFPLGSKRICTAISTFIALFAWNSLLYLNIMLLSICEFRENRRREGRMSFFSFGYKLNYIYACTMKPYDIIKVKNTLVNSAHYVTEYTTCGLFIGINDKFLNRTLSGIKSGYYLKSSFNGYFDNFTDRKLEVDRS